MPTATLLPVVTAMKHPFLLALLAASTLNLSVGWQDVLAQEAESQQSIQSVTGAEQSPAPVATSGNGTHFPSPYEMQEEAIKKGLADNAVQPQTTTDRYNPGTTSSWPSTPKFGSVSKLKGVASAAGRVMARTAAVALPTAGFVLLGAALTRSAMPLAAHRGMLGGNQYGGNYYGQPGYSQMNGFPKSATSSLAGGAANYYGNPYYTGH
jgi:hypothetical protein